MRHAFARAFFGAVHGHQLVYNTCWEDPRLDRQALAIGPDDRILAISSAGCNVLDYALDAPREIVAVDLNPRQNALVELKQAGIRALEYDEFFCLFGRGHLPSWHARYQRLLRPQLSAWAQRYWDSHGRYFAHAGRRGFFFRGTAGGVARLLNAYIDHIARVRPAVTSLLAAASTADQQEIYERGLRRRLWGATLRRLAGHDAILSLLAVPRPQREHLERDYPRGIADFIERRIETVFTQIPIHDNYFWRVYLTGEYSPTCCPEYLTPTNFARLKAGLVDRIRVWTGSVERYLLTHDETISRFVLLDHMDWLCSDGRGALQAEWQAIVTRATPGARAIWRSGGRDTAFVDDLDVRVDNQRRPVGSLLRYARDLAAELHARDRVHTYGSFHVADIVA